MSRPDLNGIANQVVRRSGQLPEPWMPNPKSVFHHRPTSVLNILQSIVIKLLIMRESGRIFRAFDVGGAWGAEAGRGGAPAVFR